MACGHSLEVGADCLIHQRHLFDVYGVIYLDGSMVVSGAFFHAASFGLNVVARDGEFARWLAERQYGADRCKAP